MFVDSLGVVSDAQALTSTALSTSSVDLGNVTPKRNIGDGEVVGFAVTVGVAADSTTGDETYEVDLVQSANADLSSSDTIAKYPYTATQVHTGGQLAAGAAIFIPIPPGWPTKRYIGLNYVLGGTTPSITVTASLMTRSAFSKLPQSYASGFTID